ncbi:hypothetical protein [Paenibacillus eucommiae]|uniref:Uncharacterized protein n=1 Tax=Paenibacillus eucommiae TaxID=1355755 RepID=A0ABS4J1P3_9BACL|nr:hypothetical protein [Paenibacillus eucommiae]MBP1993752.1 hypothetical protein [Paenibacillus eucommiae]
MKDSNENKVHETEPDPVYFNQENQALDTELLPMQSIEGAGPPRKVDLSTLPRPLRAFHVFILIFSLVMVLSVVFVTIFR